MSVSHHNGYQELWSTYVGVDWAAGLDLGVVGADGVVVDRHWGAFSKLLIGIALR